MKKRKLLFKRVGPLLNLRIILRKLREILSFLALVLLVRKIQEQLTWRGSDRIMVLEA